MTGALDASWADNGRLRFSGSNAGGFAWSAEGLSLICTQANVRLEGGEKGVSADWDLILDRSGRFRGGFSSSDPAAAALPERGRFQASWQAIDIALLRPLIAERALDLQGRLNGNIQVGFLALPASRRRVG